MARLIGSKGMNSLSIKDSRGRERVLNRSKDGTFHVNDPKLIRALKEEGMGVAGVAPVGIGKGGWPCAACGFASVYKQCSKCGVINE